jgi:acyl transferase domain-containing protein
MEDQHQSETRTGLEIAVVGMAGRFPGANSVAQLWDALLAKRETISFFGSQELRDEGIPADLLADPNYVRAAGILDR